MRYLQIYNDIDRMGGPSISEETEKKDRKDASKNTYIPPKMPTTKFNSLNNDKKVESELEKKLAKQETFDFFDKNLTEENIKSFVNDNTKIVNINKGKNILEENNRDISLLTDYFKENPNKSDLLNLIVENGAFNIFGVCPSDKEVGKLKNLYKEKHKKKIIKILSNYRKEDGSKVSFKDVFSDHGKCEPLKLADKLQGLVDKEGNIIRKKDIKNILSLTGKVKKLDAKDHMLENVFEDNIYQFRKYIKIIKGIGVIFYSHSEKKQKSIIEDVLNNIGIKIKKTQLKALHKNTLTYLNASELDKKIGEQLKEYNQSLKRSEKFANDDKKLTKYIKEKISISENGNLPEEFRKDNLGGFYTKAYNEQKSAKVYIEEHMVKNSDVGFINKAILKNIVLPLIEGSKKSTGEIAKSILDSSIARAILPDSKIKALERISNNGREMDFFLNNNILYNTETIWLYSNNPKDLDEYSIEGFSKAPGTEGKNQVTSRTKFLQILKNTKDFSQINARGLVDYFLKAKIKYGNLVIEKIYTELGEETFQNLTRFLGKKIGSEKQEYSVLNNFLSNKDNINIVKQMLDFHDFADKKTVSSDLNLFENVIKSGAKKSKKITKYYDSINNGKIIKSNKKESNKTANIINDKNATNEFASNIKNKLAANTLNSGKKGKEEIDKIEDQELKKTLQGLSEIFEDLGIKNIGIELGTEVLDTFASKLFKPDDAAKYLINILLIEDKIPSNKFIDTVNKILKLFGKSSKEIVNFINGGLNNFLKQKTHTEEEIKTFLDNISIVGKDEISKGLLKKYLDIYVDGNKELGEIVDILSKHLAGDKIDINKFKKLLEKNNGNTGNTTKVEKAGKNYGQTVDNSMRSNIDTKQGQEKAIEETKQKAKKEGRKVTQKELGQVENEAIVKEAENNEEVRGVLKQKAEAELSLAKSGFYTKEEKQAVYQNMYSASYLDNDFKDMVKEQAESEGIKLRQENAQSKPIYVEGNNTLTNVDNIEDLGTIDKINLDYESEGGLVKVQNPFAQEGIEPKEIEGKNMKEANERLLLSYLNKLGFYHADEIFLGKDTANIEQIFGIDITKQLDIDDIKIFSINLNTGLIYKLKNIDNVSSVHKKYIDRFEQKMIENPYDFSLYEEMINFLNDNVNLFIKTGYYDFTEKSIKLDGFVNKEKDEKYRKYLRKLNLFEKVS